MLSKSKLPTQVSLDKGLNGRSLAKARNAYSPMGIVGDSVDFEPGTMAFEQGLILATSSAAA